MMFWNVYVMNCHNARAYIHPHKRAGQKQWSWTQKKWREKERARTNLPSLIKDNPLKFAGFEWSMMPFEYIEEKAHPLGNYSCSITNQSVDLNYWTDLGHGNLKKLPKRWTTFWNRPHNMTWSIDVSYAIVDDFNFNHHSMQLDKVEILLLASLEIGSWI